MNLSQCRQFQIFDIFLSLVWKSIFINITMFQNNQGKSTFLQKKQQQKQKAVDQKHQKTKATLLQKHIRAYLGRRQVLDAASDSQLLKIYLLMDVPLELSLQDLMPLLQELKKQKSLFYTQRLILQYMSHTQLGPYCLRLLQQSPQVQGRVFSNKKFIKILQKMLRQDRGRVLLNMAAPWLSSRELFDQINSQILEKGLLTQFSQGFVEIESVFEGTMTRTTIDTVLQSLSKRKHIITTKDIYGLAGLIADYLSRKLVNFEQTNILNGEQGIICYCLSAFLSVGVSLHQQITFELIKESRGILAMVDDEELLLQIQTKLRGDPRLQEFTNTFLSHMQTLITHKLMLFLFEKQTYVKINNVLLATVNQLNILFEDRRLIFLRELISSDRMLKYYATSRDPIFYQAFKMRLLGMDDRQFSTFDIFKGAQWKNLIVGCIGIADLKIQKLSQKQIIYVPGQLLPFKKRNSDQVELKNVVDILTNLYKRAHRTGLIPLQIFVNHQISGLLQTFLFGKGARRIEMLLKELPFIFSFQSRMARFKEFIKADKKNYDRTLFLQDQIDPQLVIAVRRGSEFMDAFEACMTRDLRKKYKIVFFNQQGMEEEGVDGGGIIKEFINRVLKSSFSQNYGLFHDTPQRQALPNPYSPLQSQYEFVGRLVGKAVYEGINIQQKFAQPFLNLLIGRQNSFQDLQFIDRQIYQNLLKLKHDSPQNIALMEQTFVIYDKMPNGQARYVDLLCPQRAPSNKQTMVDANNRMQFILSYADFKCNTQIQQQTRLFKKGFLRVIKQEWLTMFSNQELNLIISGTSPDFSVQELKANTLYNDYHEKNQTIVFFWQVLEQLSAAQKSLFLAFVTSCPRPPTLGFGALKPKMCINRDQDASHLPTANTCMNVLRLPDYKNKALLKSKLLYAINARAGFEFM